MIFQSLATIFSVLVVGALCNTEILNFASSEAVDAVLPFVGNWQKLQSDQPEIKWEILAAPLGSDIDSVCPRSFDGPVQDSGSICPHELWVVLDLQSEEWSSWSKFTLRLSYPASSPANIFMDIYDPETLAALMPSNLVTVLPSTRTRRKYAHVRVISDGVLTPKAGRSHTKEEQQLTVPFILILEPLDFGVLPKSMRSVVVAIFLVTSFGLFLAPRVYKYMREVAAQAQADRARKDSKEE